MVMGTMSEFRSNQFFSRNKLSKSHPFIQQDQFLDVPFPLGPNDTLNLTQSQNFYDNQTVSLSSNASPDGESHEDSVIFSDIALTYISQMLMGEDDKIDNFQALEATEKPFYELIGETYPPSTLYPSPDSNHSTESPDSISSHHGSSSSSNGSGSGSGVVESHWPYEYSDYQLPIEFASQSSVGSITGFSNALEVSGDGFTRVSNLFLDPAWQFNKGVEEARKFLPSNANLVIDLEANRFSLPLEPKEEGKLFEVKPEYANSSFGARGRKNPHSDDDLEEGRSMKQSAVFSEEAIRSQDFDAALLCHGDTFPKVINDLREALQHVANKSSQNGTAKRSNGGKGRGKRQPEKEVVDLRTMLVHCAQMVAADDHRSTGELLKQIRQHSSQHGDGSQRLAHYFANGIEARMAGTGSEIYNSYKSQRKTATEFLKAYQLYVASCPFKKISHFFSNQTILNVSEKAKKVHVIDFGIGFGFQWPSLIQRIASRPGGPPDLRITGIDIPQPGFRPAERLEETGRRLADYAQSFNVPLEYKAIVSKWEDVSIEDLDIRGDEVLVVNCLYQMKYLADESVMVDSPRNAVLNTIRKMNPSIFILGIVNGAYSAPFFVTRFREALYHFSALYDMLDTIIPRENEQRLLSEREILGREALNVIACEGLERVERPETYKQWQVRNLRAGFRQHPPSHDVLKKGRDKVKNFYHKDFNIDEDSRWLLQGWKGRILYALSAWVPNTVP